LRLGQKCSAARNKKKNPKIISYIFEIFRIISEETAFETPFIRKKRLRQKCPASRNKKKNPKIVSYIFEIFRIISEEAAFETPFIRKKGL
jgi:hypothetical protein